MSACLLGRHLRSLSHEVADATSTQAASHAACSAPSVCLAAECIVNQLILPLPSRMTLGMRRRERRMRRRKRS